MKINTPTRITTDDLQGDWKKDSETLVGAIGDFQDQTTRAINGQLTIRENTTSFEDDYDLDHGVQIRLKNPLGVPCRGVFAVRCVGVELGSDGKPTRKLYNTLGMPRIDWYPADSNGGNLLVTAYFPAPASGVGSIGERYSISRVRSANTAITSGAGGTMNICATPSVTIPPGTWSIMGTGSFSSSAGTTVTDMQVGISKTSAALPAADTMGAPTNGEFRMRITSAASLSTTGEWGLVLPPYQATFASATPLFLIAQTTFATSTMFVYGYMEVLRMLNGNDATPPRGRVRLFFYGG